MLIKKLALHCQEHHTAKLMLEKSVSLKDAKAGDLLFFGKNGVSHVGIYAGNYSMVHASPRKGVCFVNLSDYNMANFKWAKNIIDN